MELIKDILTRATSMALSLAVWFFQTQFGQYIRLTILRMVQLFVGAIILLLLIQVILYSVTTLFWWFITGTFQWSILLMWWFITGTFQWSILLMWWFLELLESTIWWILALIGLI